MTPLTEPVVKLLAQLCLTISEAELSNAERKQAFDALSYNYNAEIEDSDYLIIIKRNQHFACSEREKHTRDDTQYPSGKEEESILVFKDTLTIQYDHRSIVEQISFNTYKVLHTSVKIYNAYDLYKSGTTWRTV